ncbi:hypothetical protein [Tautonia plasticadhaerens]|nr:hypothetical protein [Tautonia plasticadhaerens]
MLADPRVHLACVGIALGAYCASPRMGEAVGSFQAVAVGSLDRLGVETGKAIGLGGFGGPTSQAEEYSYYREMDARLSAGGDRAAGRY